MSRVLLSANSFWNIVNFREPLVEALVQRGHELFLAAPDVDRRWAGARGADAINMKIDRSGLNPFTDAALWFTYLRLFRSVKPNFYLGFTAKPNIYGCLAAAASGVTSLPNVSGLGTAFMNDGLLSRFVSSLYRMAFRQSPIVFFQNEDDLAQFVAEAIVRRDQARLLPGSGIDLDRFAPAPWPPGPGQPVFLFIGRLLGDKGVREFVEAARQLRSVQPEWRFQLLGELDPANRSGVKADELGQWVEQGLVEHLGHADDVRPHIAAATAVVLPSYREGLPRSLLEGAAMARPLIATDVPGNRRLVMNGVTGLLCEVCNPHSLADAIRRLGAMGSGQRAQMGLAGREFVEREFGIEHVVRAYTDALAQLARPGRV